VSSGEYLPMFQSMVVPSSSLSSNSTRLLGLFDQLQHRARTLNIPALGDLSRLGISSLCNLFTFRPSFITCSCFKIFYSDVFGYRIP
jgi:hypothetical protein